MLFSLTGCSANSLLKENLSTDTWSSIFEDQEDKIDFFKKYVACPTEILDAEYHIDFHDNSGGFVPGPSDWKICAAIKVDAGDIAAWTDGLVVVPEEDIDMTWWNELDTADWDFSGTAAYYKRPGWQTYLVVYEKQGILLKYIFAH
jgi:hypothetical protein